MWSCHNCLVILTSSAIDYDISRMKTEWVRHWGDTSRSWFFIIYGFIMSCKKLNNVCTLVTNCFCGHSSVILVFFFPSWTKITLSWAPKQFVTQVDTLFSMSFFRQFFICGLGLVDTKSLYQHCWLKSHGNKGYDSNDNWIVISM